MSSGNPAPIFMFLGPNDRAVLIKLKQRNVKDNVLLLAVRAALIVPRSPQCQLRLIDALINTSKMFGLAPCISEADPRRQFCPGKHQRCQ